MSDVAQNPGAPTGEPERQSVSLRDLSLYFLKLGSSGFGGPIALAGYMQRDLLEQRHWITKDEYQDGLAIAQTMPGPLAAQLAMWIGFIRYGALGATLAGTLFIVTPFILVLVIAVLYVQFEGLSVIRALFYGIGPATIAIISLSAWRLAKTTDGQDPRLWVISAILLVVTVATGSELAYLFVAAGIVTSIVYSAPWRRTADGTTSTSGLLSPFVPAPLLAITTLSAGGLLTMTLFFLKASAFTFGSGLAIVPFLHQGVVIDHGWLTEREFLDAVALGIITPGPVVIMATFVGYLVGGVPGAFLAAFGVFAPVWVINVIIGRLFLRYRQHPYVRGFVKGATAAAIGALGGACIILGDRAIIDPVTVVIFLAALPLLYFKRLNEPAVIGLGGIIGLIAF